MAKRKYNEITTETPHPKLSSKTKKASLFLIAVGILIPPVGIMLIAYYAAKSLYSMYRHSGNNQTAPDSPGSPASKAIPELILPNRRESNYSVFTMMTYPDDTPPLKKDRSDSYVSISSVEKKELTSPDMVIGATSNSDGKNELVRTLAKLKIPNLNSSSSYVGLSTATSQTNNNDPFTDLSSAVTYASSDQFNSRSPFTETKASTKVGRTTSKDYSEQDLLTRCAATSPFTLLGKNNRDHAHNHKPQLNVTTPLAIPSAVGKVKQDLIKPHSDPTRQYLSFKP